MTVALLAIVASLSWCIYELLQYDWTDPEELIPPPTDVVTLQLAVTSISIFLLLLHPAVSLLTLLAGSYYNFKGKK